MGNEAWSEEERKHLEVKVRAADSQRAAARIITDAATMARLQCGICLGYGHDSSACPAPELSPMSGSFIPHKDEASRAGVKADAQKPRFSLVPRLALNTVIAALEFGAKKYAPDNWRKVPDARRRYFDAAHRHIDAWWGGEKLDEQSGLHHLGHALCCLLFALELELEADK